MEVFRRLFRSSDTTDINLRERLIRKIVLCGTVLSVVSWFEVLLLTSTLYALIPITLITIVLISSFILIYKYRKLELSVDLAGIFCTVFAFPCVFFLSGGVDSGATVWFVLGIFYAIGMYHGKKMVLYLIFTVIVDCITYYIGYKYPQFIISLGSKSKIYADSLFAVIVVGILLGVVTKYQLNAYDKERQYALKQKDEIAKFSNSKNDFFASMSHEIRTPINTIIGLNEMILRDKTLSKAVVEDLITVQNASKMLLSMVSDILDLSLIESNKMEITPVKYNTKELFASLVDMTKIRIKEKNLDFIVNIDSDIPAVLYGDEKRIKQVVLNILNNAVKYTKEGSVSFIARTEKIGEEWCKLIISVEDTGIGIKAENIDDLFNSLKNIELSDSQRNEGTGLGLSISKRLVDLMDGELTVDSIYTRGSNFTIILEQQVMDIAPMGVVDFITKKEKRPENYQHLFEAPEARILIVDDNEMNRVVVTKLLKDTKVQLDTASSGKECLEMTRKKYYNIILMDYMMPGMDGAETLNQVRRQENGLCKDSPIIVLTEDQMLTVGRRFIEMGFDGMLEKPFRGSELEQGILNFLPDEVLEYRLDFSEKNDIGRNENILFSEKNKTKVKITADCVCDITEEWLEKYDIELMYLYINSNKSRFKDRKEIDSDSIANFLTVGKFDVWAETATIEDYEEFFASQLVENEEVIHISLGVGMGKSYANASKASKGFGHVHVVDSGHISGGMALVVMAAVSKLNEGASIKEILNEIERVKRNVFSGFLFPNLESYANNGYVNSIFAKMMDNMGLHPRLKVWQSDLHIVGFSFGNYRKTIYRYVRKLLLYRKQPVYDIIYITHAGLTVNQQEMILEEISKLTKFNRIIMQKCSVTNACFSGIGTIGIAFVTER